MYKFKIDDELYTYFEPQDKNLAKEITKEVTKDRKADTDGFVEVTEEERNKIQELYAESNKDPEPIVIENKDTEKLEMLENTLAELMLLVGNMN